jgi:hypothetical protein
MPKPPVILPGLGCPGQKGPEAIEAEMERITRQSEADAALAAERRAASDAHLGPDWKAWRRPSVAELEAEKKPGRPTGWPLAI